ncbi:MAG: AraC family transcriptional regulator [Tannerellaceae bacterium]|jgi:AraC-like DNA-binding protein|nr:AraC family transcriptional regulator [Tannerellaceae bacterium]
MKTTFNEQQDSNDDAVKKMFPSDFVIDFNLRHEKKNASIQTKDKHLNHLLFILEGEMNISYHEFRNHLCKTGEMVFIPRDSPAYIDAYTDVNYLLLSFNNQFVIKDEIGWNDLQEFENERDVFHKLDIRSPLSDVLDSIVYYQQHRIYNPNLNLVKQKELFLVMKVFYSRQEIARFLKPMIKQDTDFKAYVINHYKETKNVEELAAMCNLSPRAFIRKFKIHFNDSPYRWILRQKANYIRLLLADKKIPMISIIQEYGFSSPAHFTTYCKKQFGETPSALRNALNGKVSVAVAPNGRHPNSAEAQSGADDKNQSHTG